MSKSRQYVDIAGSVPFYDLYRSDDGEEEKVDPVNYDPDRPGGYRCPVGFGRFRRCGGPTICDSTGTIMCGNCHMWLENHRPIPK